MCVYVYISTMLCVINIIQFNSIQFNSFTQLRNLRNYAFYAITHDVFGFPKLLLLKMPRKVDHVKIQV